MAENIFKYGTSFELYPTQTVYRDFSHSGIGRTQVVSPLFYSISTEVRPLYRPQYLEILSDLAESRQGVLSINKSVPYDHTWIEGTWAGNPIVNGPDQSGRTLNLSGLSEGSTALLGDWIQVFGSSKVYQVDRNATAAADGTMSVTLNTPLVGVPTDNAAIVLGPDVLFKILTTEIPPVITIPGARGQPLYQFQAPFQFREIR